MAKLTSPPAFTRVASGDSGSHIPGDLVHAHLGVLGGSSNTPRISALGSPLGVTPTQLSAPYSARDSGASHQYPRTMQGTAGPFTWTDDGFEPSTDRSQ